MKVRVILACSLLVALGCDGSPMPEDGGPPRDTGPDTGHVDVCDRNEACRDDLFCNGVEQCMPGTTGADARGCVAGTPPCSAGDVCVEAEDRCESDDCADGGDGDGDGERRPECGGNDCDDSDGSRYPSNVEVCDAEGHDEDCNPATFGNTDADSDTFVSSACCNGDNCGPDCNDGDPDVNPSQVEVCDAADNNCSGAADDASGLCPGGLCRLGMCDFDAWSASFGSTLLDTASSIVIAADGSVLVAGKVGGSTDFGAGLVPLARRSLFVVRYGPTGTRSWVYTAPDCDPSNVDIAVGPSDLLYVVGTTTGTRCDFGSGPAAGGFLLVLNGTDGSYVQDRRFATCTGTECSLSFLSVLSDPAGIQIGGSFRGTYDFGGGPRTGAAFATALLLELDHASRSYVRDRQYPVSGTGTRGSNIRGIARVGADFIVSGTYTGGTFDLGGRVFPSSTSTSHFVARLDSEGAAVSGYAVSAPNLGVNDVAVDGDGRVHMAARFTGVLDLGGGMTRMTASTSDYDGILISLSPDLVVETSRTFSGATPLALAVDASSNVYVAGELFEPTNFGRGTISPPASGMGGFLAEYSTSGDLGAFTTYGFSDRTSVTDVAVGPGGSTAITGSFFGTIVLDVTHSAVDSADVFVLRLGS